jgi:hypothetical protein
MDEVRRCKQGDRCNRLTVSGVFKNVTQIGDRSCVREEVGGCDGITAIARREEGLR